MTFWQLTILINKRVNHIYCVHLYLVSVSVQVYWELFQIKRTKNISGKSQNSCCPLFHSFHSDLEKVRINGIFVLKVKYRLRFAFECSKLSGLFVKQILIVVSKVVNFGIWTEKFIGTQKQWNIHSIQRLNTWQSSIT